MRKVVLAMNTTLNGTVDDLFTWFDEVTDDLYTEIDRGLAGFDTVLVGRISYDGMLAYWPGAETEEGGSPIDRSVARKLNAYKKYVFSSTVADGQLEWNNAEPVAVSSDQDIVTFLNALKAQPGRDIYVAGGTRLATTLVRLALIDEYRLFVYPVVSPGTAWFDQVEDQRGMRLISTTPYQNGVVGLYFRPDVGFSA
jgi:dihydrofolate reductase